MNSGVCSWDPNSQIPPTCLCPAGFAGDDCSAVTCGTQGVACFNGGQCNETSGTCICPPPLTSDDCRGSEYYSSFKKYQIYLLYVVFTKISVVQAQLIQSFVKMMVSVH